MIFFFMRKESLRLTPVLTVLLLFIVCARSGAQSALYRIAGTVVDSISGNPLERASVSLLETENDHILATTRSDNNGHFAFAPMPQGRFQLSVSRRGYLPSLYMQHGAYNSAIVTGAEQQTESLVFLLPPAASLSISIADESGDPVEDATLHIFRRVHDQKSDFEELPPRALSMDEEEQVEIGNLEPGEYDLAVSARPWFALRGNPEDTSRYNPALDLAYPLTFFDGATSEANASPIQLASGQHESVQIHLQTVPALRLTLPAGENKKEQDNLTLSAFGFSLQPPEAEWKNSTVDTSISGLAPGHYSLQLSHPARLLNFDATSSQQIASGAPASAIRVKLVGSSLPSAIPRLTPADHSHPPLTVSQDGQEFLFPAVPPGIWELTVSSDGLYPLPVLSVENESGIHAGNLVKITEKSHTLRVNLNHAESRIQGFAQADGKGRAGVLILLIPTKPAIHSDLFRRDQSDSDGSFNLLQVAPGDYSIVAIEDGWELEWQRPEVLARFLSHAVAVHLPVGRNQPLVLPLPVPIQSKKGELLPAPAETSPQSSFGTSSKPGGEDSL